MFWDDCKIVSVGFSGLPQEAKLRKMGRCIEFDSLCWICFVGMDGIALTHNDADNPPP